MASNYNSIKKLAQSLKRDLSVLDYFFKLEKSGMLKYEGKQGKEYFFGWIEQKTGSISISDENLWFDHSNDRGGDIIEAVMFFESKSFFDAVNSLSKETPVFFPQERIIKSKSHSIEILEEKRIESKALLDYLALRSCSVEIVENYVNEVHWRRGDKKYYAIGLKTDSGGYVLRSSLYKGTIISGGKTSIKIGQPKDVRIFEGMFDFLSFMELKLADNFWAIVLNSRANLTFGLMLNLLSQPLPVNLYLDNDLAGKSKTEDFINLSKLFIYCQKNSLKISPDQRFSNRWFENLCSLFKIKDIQKEVLELESPINDRSGLYSEFNDLNNWHVNK